VHYGGSAAGPPMLAILNVIAPVFALIVTGYMAVRWRLYPKAGVGALVAFVNNFATPCLLFQAMATSDFSSVFNFAIILPFYAGALVSLFVGTMIAIRVFKTRPGEGVSSGFAAMFTNTVLVGIPVLSRAYGEQALPTAFSIIAFHAPVLITLGMLVMELVRRDGAPIHQALWAAVIRIVSNPLLWGVVLGALVNAAHIHLIEPVDAFLDMMSAAVVPAALFGLGGALNEYRFAENWQQALVMSALKLISQPLIAWVIMIPILHLPMETARYGILLAAMPAGINAYVFATYYNRGANVAANTVLITTVLSAFTVSAWLYFLSL
jgi:malonate transporter and related proteins